MLPQKRGFNKVWKYYLMTGSQQPHFKTRHCLLGAAASCFLIGVVSMTFSRLKVEVYLICSAQLVDAEDEILGYISIPRCICGNNINKWYSIIREDLDPVHTKRI